MKRALPIIVLSVVAAAAACADTNDEPPTPTVDPDASVQAPASDAGVTPEASAEAGADTGAEAAAPPTCNDDGWCLVALPNPRSIGVKNFRPIGLAMDGPGSVWAASYSFPVADGDTTSHILHYENGTWNVVYGIGPNQPGPLPYTLVALASNDAGALLAVGMASSYNVYPRPAAVVRVENGKAIEEHPDGIQELVSVGFTSATDAWALDNEGRLYKTTIGGDGPLVWAEQESPHQPPPSGFPRGASLMFVSTDKKLVLFGEDSSVWPSRLYVDRQMDDRSWVTTFLPDGFFSITTGVSSAPDALWLAGTSFLGATGLPSAPDAGEPVWTSTPAQFDWVPRALWARSENDVWSVGDVGRVFHFDGTAWKDAALALGSVPMTVEYLNSITGWPATGEMWVGGESVVMHYTPKGTP